MRLDKSVFILEILRRIQLLRHEEVQTTNTVRDEAGNYDQPKEIVQEQDVILLNDCLGVSALTATHRFQYTTKSVDVK